MKRGRFIFLWLYDKTYIEFDFAEDEEGIKLAENEYAGVVSDGGEKICCIFVGAGYNRRKFCL